MSGVAVRSLKRDHLSFVGTCPVDQVFDLAEKRAGKLGACFARRHCNLDAHSQLLAKSVRRSQENSKRQLPHLPQPEPVLQTPRRYSLTNIDLVMLKRTHKDWKLSFY